MARLSVQDVKLGNYGEVAFSKCKSKVPELSVACQVPPKGALASRAARLEQKWNLIRNPAIEQSRDELAWMRVR